MSSPDEDYSVVTSSYENYQARRGESKKGLYDNSDDEVSYNAQKSPSRPNSRPKSGYESTKSFSREVENDFMSLMSSGGSSKEFRKSDDDSDYLSYINKRNLELKQHDEQIKAESEHVLKKASMAVSEQTKKLKEREAATIVAPPVRPPSSAGKKPATPARPGSAIQKDNVETNDQDDDIDVMAAKMGPEAAAKFYRARLKILEKDMKEVVDKLKDREEKLADLDSKYKEQTKEMKLLTKQATQHQQKVDKQKKEHDMLQDKYKNSVAQVNELKKEVDTLKKNNSAQPSAKRNASPPGVKDVRLNRALEEMEKYKTQIADLNREKREATDGLRKENDKLRNENKKMDRQKQDLLMAFRKQMKLIDILKRQKVHLEAARLLAFTEEEFTKILETDANK
jgi:hypothetical protein